MGAVESPQFQDHTDIFDTAISKGLTRDSLERIPKVLITDTFGELVSCSVCLQVCLVSHLTTICSALENWYGAWLGSLTGALIGQETESGFIRGAAVGAISGDVFSIKVFESSLLLWQSDESGIGCLLYLIDVIASLLSGRLVRERIGPAMLSAVQSQMGAVESPQFQDHTDIFDTAISKGLTRDSLERIPKVLITDTFWELVFCSVCLQVCLVSHLTTIWSASGLGNWSSTVTMNELKPVIKTYPAYEVKLVINSSYELPLTDYFV